MRPKLINFGLSIDGKLKVHTKWLNQTEEMKKKAFIEIKILQMENINPSLSDGIGVFWELVITTLQLSNDKKALKIQSLLQILFLVCIVDIYQLFSIDKYFLSLNLGSRSFWRYYLWKNVST